MSYPATIRTPVSRTEENTMFSYPMYQQPKPKSMKEQIDEAEFLLDFMKKKFEKKEEKGPTKLKDKKFSLWETGLVLAVVSFICAVPIVTYQLHSLLMLKQAMDAVMK